MGEIREREIEAYLVRLCLREGWKALKYSNAVEVGFPDRLVLTGAGRCFWVELKAPGKKPRKIQQTRAWQLQGMGYAVHTADSRESVEEIIAEERGRLKGGE